MRALTVALIVLVAVFAAMPIRASVDKNIDAITVKIVSDKNIPEKIAKRMEASVLTVGEHVLLGHKVSEINIKKAGYEKLVKEVFDRVLVGYTIDNVTIQSDNNTQIVVKINPWGEVVKKVVVEYDYGGMTPEATVLIREELGKIETKITDVLLGLPIDAVDWAGSVLKNIIREQIAADLPEYRTNIEIIPGTKVVVRIMLQPQGAVIRGVNVIVKSQSLPKLLVADLQPATEKQAKVMYGLPVGFVDRYRSYFTELIRNNLLKHSLVKRYGLKPDIELNPASQSEIIIYANTDKYLFTLEGYLEMGKLNDNTSAKLHAGRRYSNRDELFTEITFIPSTFVWDFELGWGHKLYHNTSLGFRYNVGQKYNVLWLNQQLGHNWSMRLERAPGRGYNEVGIRYKLHDFLSAEYIINSKEHWLRFVGNL